MPLDNVHCGMSRVPLDKVQCGTAQHRGQHPHSTLVFDKWHTETIHANEPVSMELISSPSPSRVRYHANMLRLAAVVLLAMTIPGAQARPATQPGAIEQIAQPPRVLIYSRTAGFRHASIPDGIAAIEALAEVHGFIIDATEDPTEFTDANLDQYAVVVFLSTTGDILDENQQAAFEGFIAKGRGFVGIHAAADTEYDWPWYGQLVGGYFKSHPTVQPAVVRVIDRNHPATSHLDEAWKRTDEWYNFRESPRGKVRVLMELDESTYKNGTMGDDHPIAWCHEFGGGRAFYTGGGHTIKSYAEQWFLEHIIGAIRWAAGVDGDTVDGESADTPSEEETTPIVR